MPAEHHQEVELTGGTANQGLVVRLGDTVRRPWRPTTPSTHALLMHLQEVGFDGAPRLLGVDERGREVLTYVPGTAISPPYPPWSLTTSALESVARLLHRYHDAVASFDGGGLAWQLPVPERFTTGLVSHNDPNLDNVVFRDGVAVALIDFDLARPRVAGVGRRRRRAVVGPAAPRRGHRRRPAGAFSAAAAHLRRRLRPARGRARAGGRGREAQPQLVLRQRAAARRSRPPRVLLLLARRRRRPLRARGGVVRPERCALSGRRCCSRRLAVAVGQSR